VPHLFIRSLRGITFLLLVMLAQPQVAGAAAGTSAGAAGGIPAGEAGGIPARVEDGTAGRTGSEATGETQGRERMRFSEWGGPDLRRADMCTSSRRTVTAAAASA
jgi:hypothetical protein